MIKNTFIYVVLVIFIGVGVWFFLQKANNSNDSGGIDKLVGNIPTPTATSEATKVPETGAVMKDTKRVKLEGGLEYEDLVVGSGAEAKSGDMIATHYNGTLSDGTKFDSSYDRGQPFAFILGGGMVIKGWDVGIVGMKVGGKRKLMIPPQMGYGNMARPKIPANSTLFFEVELIAVKPQGK